MPVKTYDKLDESPAAPGGDAPRDARARRGYIWALVLFSFLGVLTVLAFAPKVGMRFTILRWKVSGSLPDVSYPDLYRMLRPGRHFNLSQLASSPNPYAAIRNPYVTAGDIHHGKDLFRSHCAGCHGPDGSGGGVAPALRDRHMVQGGSDWALFRTISSGVRGTAMRGFDLPWLDKWQLVAFLSSLAQHEQSGLSEITIPVTPVSFESILKADETPDRWLTYSGSYNGHRFSPNKQITRSNVAGLRLLWIRQYNTPEISIETTPLVVDGYMFVTVPPNRVEALNATTGALIWTYDRQLPDHLSLCCGQVNRGLAVLGGKLYLGTLDAHLVALEMQTGKVSWDIEIADHRNGYSITGAPLALKDVIVTGVSGGEFGIRGFVDARDATTGKEVWRFNTVPGPGEPGAQTWQGISAQKGGGPAWLTGSYDPVTNLLYWPIGNPSPNFNGDGRAGDNLYTNSVVALDADHGTLQWYFQFMPHDLFDWDATEIPVLFDADIAGQRRRLLAQANRNGFFYLIDARSGKLLLAKPFARQNWSDGLDAQGRPKWNANAHPTMQGTAIYPGVGGGTNWESPAYNPLTGLMYVPALDWGGIFYTQPGKYHPGDLYLGGSFQYFPAAGAQAAVRALNPLTGEVQWEYLNAGTNVGGLLSTAGGLVFGSQNQAFFALDAETGHELWHVNTGGRVVAVPITFTNSGKQLVTIAAGHDILTFGL